jgi:hypothetical protein
MFDTGNPYLIDLAFWAQLLRHGDAFVDQARLAAFRVSRNSVSTKIGLRQAASFRRFVRLIHRDQYYQASALDVLMGYFLSFHWCLLRNFLIRLQARKRAPATAAQGLFTA